MKRILLITIALSVWMWADAVRYTRSDAGIVTDNKTGLQWQDDYSDNGGDIKYAKWTDAIAYCEDLTLGGHSDWRLPNKKELLSIVDYGRYNPSIDTVFTHTTSDYYWGSTAPASGTGSAWIVYFSYGYTSHYDKSYDYYVRCVR